MEWMNSYNLSETRLQRALFPYSIIPFFPPIPPLRGFLLCETLCNLHATQCPTFIFYLLSFIFFFFSLRTFSPYLNMNPLIRQSVNPLNLERIMRHPDDFYRGIIPIFLHSHIPSFPHSFLPFLISFINSIKLISQKNRIG